MNEHTLKAKLLGQTSCDTCRKARKMLESAGYTVEFRDVRAAPLSAEERARFLLAFGSQVINRASTTWRQLDETERSAGDDQLLARHPTLMKRPVTEIAGRLRLGWDAKVQADILK